jgi:hypothetical protein
MVLEVMKTRSRKTAQTMKDLINSQALNIPILHFNTPGI